MKVQRQPAEFMYTFPGRSRSYEFDNTASCIGSPFVDTCHEDKAVVCMFQTATQGPGISQPR
jgi:hypothetical protein